MSKILRYTGVSRCPEKYILRCSLDSGMGRKDGVGSADLSGVDADSTLELVQFLGTITYTLSLCQ